MRMCAADDCANVADPASDLCFEHAIVSLKTDGTPLHYRAAREAHETAGKLVQGDRRETHGDFIKNFDCIAALWTGYLRARPLRPCDDPGYLSALDVAHMMALMKIGRTMNGSYNPDDHVDHIGYAMIGAGLAAVEAHGSGE